VKIFNADFLGSETYIKAATECSKNYIFFFTIYCVYFCLFSGDYNNSINFFWWLPIWVIGNFVVSFFIACPIFALKLIFVEVFMKFSRKINLCKTIANLLDICGYVLLFYLFKFFLDYIS